MKSQVKISIAFFLNLFFSIFEFLGGLFTGSVSILSDSIHDFGDATSIGISLFLEKLSLKKPNNRYTYGYIGFSILGAIITSSILLFGSGIMIFKAVERIISPIAIDYDNMLIFAIIGVVINLFATILTHSKTSLNQKAVNLHMLEDAFGWIAVLISAIVIKITRLYIIDSIISILISIFIIVQAIKLLIQCFQMLLAKVPKNIDIDDLQSSIKELDGVLDVHHVHVWQLNEQNVFATMHVVKSGSNNAIKNDIRKKCLEFNINHLTIELEEINEVCKMHTCELNTSNDHHHCHGHNHDHYKSHHHD